MAPIGGRILIRWGHARGKAYHRRGRVRCKGMHCTVTTGRLYGVLTGTAPGEPPIYAALVREWRVGGRTVPGVRDHQWVLLTAMGPATTGPGPNARG